MNNSTNTPQLPTAPIEEEPRGYVGRDARERMLRSALHGVELGVYDERIVEWVLDITDYQTFVVIASWIERAFKHGVQEVFRPAYMAGARSELERASGERPVCCEVSAGVTRQLEEIEREMGRKLKGGVA